MAHSSSSPLPPITPQSFASDSHLFPEGLDLLEDEGQVVPSYSSVDEDQSMLYHDSACQNCGVPDFEPVISVKEEKTPPLSIKLLYKKTLFNFVSQRQGKVGPVTFIVQLLQCLSPYGELRSEERLVYKEGSFLFLPTSVSDTKEPINLVFLATKQDMGEDITANISADRPLRIVCTAMMRAIEALFFKLRPVPRKLCPAKKQRKTVGTTWKFDPIKKKVVKNLFKVLNSIMEWIYTGTLHLPKGGIFKVTDKDLLDDLIGLDADIWGKTGESVIGSAFAWCSTFSKKKNNKGIEGSDSYAISYCRKLFNLRGMGLFLHAVMERTLFRILDAKVILQKWKSGLYPDICVKDLNELRAVLEQGLIMALGGKPHLPTDEDQTTSCTTAQNPVSEGTMELEGCQDEDDPFSILRSPEDSDNSF